MNDRAPETTVESLLEHAGWVRALARRLVSDRDLAEEVVQESWLRASASPAGRPRDARAWLGRVVINVARQFGRSSARRMRRQRVTAAAGEAFHPATADLVGEAEIHQQLVAAVIALAEPYRTALLLTYFHGDSANEIARRLGLRASTVRSHVHRGLGLLRQSLARRYGEGAWRIAIAPLGWPGAGGSAVAVSSKVGVLIMKMKSGMAIAVAIGCALALFVRLDSGGSPLVPVTSSSPPTRPADANADPGTRGDGPVDDTLGRTPVAAQPGATAQRPGAAADVHVFTGRVLHTHTKEPVAGAVVRVGSRAARSGADGGFWLRAAPVPGGVFVVRASKPGFLPAEQRVNGASTGETMLDVVLMPGPAVTVTVVDDASSKPIEGARVREHRHQELLGHTDAAGGVALSMVGRDVLAVSIAAAGFFQQTWVWDRPDPEANDLEVRLKPLAWIFGTVWREDGTRAAGSWVYAMPADGVRGDSRSFSETRGHQTTGVPEDEMLRLPDGVRPTPLVREVRVHPLFGKAMQLEHPSGASIGLPGDVRPYVGTTTDAEGTFALPLPPVAGGYVLHAGGDGLVPGRLGPVSIDGANRSVRVELHLAQGATIQGRAVENGEPWHHGVVLWTRGDSRGGFVSPAADGTWVLDGVPAGAVTVAAEDRVGHRVGAPVEVRARAGEVVTVDLVWHERIARISGRVTDTAGTALEGVDVGAHASTGYSEWARTKTDADGRYALQVRADRRFYVEVSRGEIVWRRQDVEAGRDDVDFEIRALGELLLLPIDAGTGEIAVIGGLRPSAVAWRTPGATTYDAAGARLVSGGAIAVRLPVGEVDVALDLGAHGFQPVELRATCPPPDGKPAPVRIAVHRGATLALQFADPEAFQQLCKDHAFFLLSDLELDAIRGPYPQQGGGSNFNFDDVFLWLARPGLSQRRVVANSRGSWRATGLAPGRYSLRAFPDTVAFEPATFEVGVADPGAPVTLRRR